MARAELLGQVVVLDYGQKAACGVYFVAFDYHCAVVQWRLGVEHRLYHGRGYVGIDDRAGRDYAFGQVLVGEHYQCARIRLGHVLNGADDLPYNLFDVPDGHFGVRGVAAGAGIEHAALDLDVEHGDHDYYGDEY